MRMRKIFPS